MIGQDYILHEEIHELGRLVGINYPSFAYGEAPPSRGWSWKHERPGVTAGCVCWEGFAPERFPRPSERGLDQSGMGQARMEGAAMHRQSVKAWYSVKREKTQHAPRTDQQSRHLRKSFEEGGGSVASHLVTQNNVSMTKPLTDSQDIVRCDRRRWSSSRPACLPSNCRYTVTKASCSRRSRFSDSSPAWKVAWRSNSSLL